MACLCPGGAGGRQDPRRWRLHDPSAVSTQPNWETDADGSLDSTFTNGPNSEVYCLSVQADGKILVGGLFNTLAGQPRSCIARLHADGSLDNTFTNGANNMVFALPVQADGKILVGGQFTTLGGQVHNYIGRLNADGSVDTTFTPARISSSDRSRCRRTARSSSAANSPLWAASPTAILAG